MIDLIRHDNEEMMRTRIAQCIKRYGWAPEHNVEHFFHSTAGKPRNIFFTTAKGWGILGKVWDDEWRLFAEPLSPPDVRAKLVMAFCDQAFSSLAMKKVVVELTAPTRRNFLKDLSIHLRCRAVAEKLVWPVLDFEAVDLSYPGSSYKFLRNIRHRFSREHHAESVTTSEISKDRLHEIVTRWEQDRPARHRSYTSEYHELIDDDFKGTTGGRVLVVDGEAEALSTGWPVPHSATYYHAVALHTFAHWGLGEIAMMEDLQWMQRHGYALADMGGSDKNLFAFKKKFGSTCTYVTYAFSIVKI